MIQDIHIISKFVIFVRKLLLKSTAYITVLWHALVVEHSFDDRIKVCRQADLAKRVKENYHTLLAKSPESVLLHQRRAAVAKSVDTIFASKLECNQKPL